MTGAPDDLLGALSVRVTGALGFSRGTGSAAIPFLTFGPVTLTAADGTTTTFELTAETGCSVIRRVTAGR